MANSVATAQQHCGPIVETWFSPEDPNSNTLTTSLTNALAQAEGVEVTELDPLYETVDLEALSALFEGHAETQSLAATFRFSYQRWEVFVSSDGWIQICEGTAAEADGANEAVST